MPNQVCQSVIVTGVDDGSGNSPIELAHNLAVILFEPDLVSSLTDVGHNFMRSFSVFPTGSGAWRNPQVAHSNAMDEFCRNLAELAVDFVAVRWADGEEPHITRSHRDLLEDV